MSTHPNYVPAAFPTLELKGHGLLDLTDAGMSLRDYFAAKAMQGLMVNTNRNGFSTDKPMDAANAAYAMADAMLKAREVVL